MTDPRIIREAVCNNFHDAKQGFQNGAERLEICTNLSEGGTTPSFGMVRACSNLGVPLAVMIRPHGHSFVYTAEDMDIMIYDILSLKPLLNQSTDNFVFGVLNSDMTVDESSLKKLCEAARPFPITFHMAFDDVEDQFASLETLIKLGIARVLTKGGKVNTALEGLNTIRLLIEHARDRIIVMPGGGVTCKNYPDVVEKTGAREVHGTRIVSL